MEAGVIISIGALLVSLVGLLLSGRKDTRTDTATNAMLQAKLEAVLNGVDEIRVEIRSMQKSLIEHGERLAKVESRAATNSHRLDALEGKKGAGND